VPDGYRAQLEHIYPEAADLFEPYGDERELQEQIGQREVAIATEHPSVAPVLAAAREHGVTAAYYVQDYEPFFAPEGSPRADAALLTYSAEGAAHMFAKTSWLANVVAARHGVLAAVVLPSLDTRIFNSDGRPGTADGGPVRVAAMIRPRTPRRRPALTAQLLVALRETLGPALEVVTFGCTDEELATLCPALCGGEHRGIVSRHEVAALFRTCDVFVDLSVYQGFGRTGLEAMACGAVPVLPVLGGAGEYATHGRDALLLDGRHPQKVFAELRALVGDRERVAQLAAAGADTTPRFALANAGRTIAETLAAFRDSEQ
jgi:hypothetical protein